MAHFKIENSQVWKMKQKNFTLPRLEFQMIQNLFTYNQNTTLRYLPVAFTECICI